MPRSLSGGRFSARVRAGLWVGFCGVLSCALAGVLLLGVGTAAAQQAASQEIFYKKQLQATPGQSDATPSSAPSAADASPVPVVVELASEPVIQVYLAGKEAAHGEDAVNMAALTALSQAQLAAVEAQQMELLATLESQDVTFDVLYRNQRVYNGVGLMIDESHLGRLETLPQVVAVHPLALKAPATEVSVPHIHAPALWEEQTGVAGLTGRGVRIAIIDTGIDYLHTMFGGPGTGYAQNDPRIIGDVPNFPGAKVVGGWDFAGDSYNADPEAASYSPFPMPNPDPMDCFAPGHGTHVAGILAGYGVASGGATYTGPYHADLRPDDFRIAPGVAPHAEIYALKVFGCRGKTALVDAAIEWAVDPNRDGDFSDRVDIINLSLGSGYGAGYDATAVAADNAARLGVVVVSSAGNSGDTVYAVGTPGVAEGVISVAATRLESKSCAVPPCPHVDLMAEFSARGPRRGDSLLKPDLAAPGYAVHSALAGTGSAGVSLSGTSMASPHVAGAAGLLLQAIQDPTYRDEQDVIWQPEDIKARLMNTARPDVQLGLSDAEPFYAPMRIGAGRLDLAAALATQVVAYDAQSPAAVGISFGAPTVVDALRQTRNVQLENRGPAPITLTVAYSPVVTMPGVDIRLDTDLDSAALIRRPLTVTLQPYGTAVVPLTLDAQAQAMRYTRDATMADVITFPRHWLPESAGFLIVEPVAAQTDQPTLRLPVYAAPQPAANLQALPRQLDFARAIEITRTVQLVGQGFPGICQNGCNDVPAPVSAASILELHHTSGRRGSVSGLPAITFQHADLQYVGAGHRQADQGALLYFGIATHGPWSTLNEVEFNIWLDVTGDRQADYRLFNADYDGHGVSLWSQVQGGDVFITVLEDLATGERILADFINGATAAVQPGGVYNTNVILLPLPLELFDWAPEQAAQAQAGGDRTFNYRVSTYSRTFGNHPLRSPVVDSTPWLTFQMTPPALELTTSQLTSAPGSPLFPAIDGTTIQIDYRVSDYARLAPPALLIFHHTNRPGRRVETLPIYFVLPFEQFLPLVDWDARE